jgi:phosphatidate cytidylyltransferase
MTPLEDPVFQQLALGVLGILVAATAIGHAMARRATTEPLRATVHNINQRIRAWWVMAAFFVASMAAGPAGSILLFAMISVLALREFVTLAPTSRGDHRALVWSFFIVTPLQYYVIWIGWYGLFALLIPVYALIAVAIRTTLAGDTHRFLERAAVTQWGLLICVYFVSCVPALLMLRVPGFEGRNVELMFFLVLLVQLSDVLQYVWGKSLGRRPLAPAISPHKTWEGLVGGILSATAIGAAIWWATPFTPLVAGGMAFVVSLAGVTGGLVMSAIKRDRGVKDSGTLIAGHGGMLDRIDSLCFAAPVFFHLTRYFYAR